jgi:hypothetical protein
MPYDACWMTDLRSSTPLHARALESLEYIRDTMERAAGFSAVPDIAFGIIIARRHGG